MFYNRIMVKISFGGLKMKKKISLIIVSALILSLICKNSAYAATSIPASSIRNEGHYAFYSGNTISFGTGDYKGTPYSSVTIYSQPVGGSENTSTLSSESDTYTCPYDGSFKVDGVNDSGSLIVYLATYTVIKPVSACDITINEGESATFEVEINANDYCNFQYFWYENDGRDVPCPGSQGVIATHDSSGNLTLTDIPCSKDGHKFWVSAYDGYGRTYEPEVYATTLHVICHGNHPSDSSDDEDSNDENQENTNKENEDSQEVEESKPSDEIIDNSDANIIKEDVGDNSISVHNISLAITPGVFTTVVKSIDKKAPANEPVYLYSAWPISMNKNMVQELANCKNGAIYYFWHKGHLYSLTIPPKADVSKIVKSNWKYEGPLYIGQLLGTSKLIR